MTPEQRKANRRLALILLTVAIAFGALLFAFLSQQATLLNILAGVSPDIIQVTQGVIVIEAILGDIARHLGLDPLDVRQRNFYGIEDRNVTHYQMKVEDNILQPLVARLEETSGYRARRAAIAATNAASGCAAPGAASTARCTWCSTA